MLEWEEGLFRGGRALVNALWTRRKLKPYLQAEVKLASLRMELFYFAHLLAGRRLSLFETGEAVLRVGERLCLPPACSIHTETGLNRDFFLLKAGLGALSLREGKAVAGLAPRERLGFLVRLLQEEFPGLHTVWERQRAFLPAEFPVEGHFGGLGPEPRAPCAEMGSADPDAAGADRDDSGKASLDAEATETEGKGRTQVEALLGDDLRSPDVPQHTFEKVETLEEFEGLDRPLDGADEMEEHQDALEELDMRHVLRSKDRAASLYRADILMSPFELESRGPGPAQGIPYPEWDCRARKYKENWCWVRVSGIEGRDDGWAEAARRKHGARIHALKRRLEQFSTDFLRARAQPSGDELDLEAVVDARIRMRSGGAPSENIYSLRRRDLSDAATLILVDLSDSTDAWVKGEHVLETLRGALFCLGETLEAYIRDFAIAGYASDTRRSCRYFPIKDFDSPWSEAIPRLGALSPQGYTRIGPAMRHAARVLSRRNARIKAILLVSDGKPCDYDTYEGRYGIQDVKKAFWEAREQGILTHAFAVDQKARQYFPAMFDPRCYSVVGEPKDLADAIFRFFLSLKSEG